MNRRHISSSSLKENIPPTEQSNLTTTQSGKRSYETPLQESTNHFIHTQHSKRHYRSNTTSFVRPIGVNLLMQFQPTTSELPNDHNIPPPTNSDEQSDATTNLINNIILQQTTNHSMFFTNQEHDLDFGSDNALDGNLDSDIDNVDDYMVEHHLQVDGKNYQANTRTYNAMFSLTSPGMKFDTEFTKGGGPLTLRIQGQTCHRIGTMLPEISQPPKYAQFYIFDTDNEIENQMECFRVNKHINKTIVTNLRLMLDQDNVHAKAFRMTRDMLKNHNVKDLKLRLVSDHQQTVGFTTSQ
ncbi:hypothetical protein KIW84_055001 [Lathyrus oleraceus]|uniref:Uncharacterized protein n=1 Tax=Pisum sativum TaxID=3888 RepID=A0A9D5AKT6_PEA|nr:hypothetical protein KIW84_055001 [Pisum sativum]